MKELLKKIATVKSEIGKISKESTNPFFKSKYFDINTLLEHVEPLLEKYGLLLVQPILDNKVHSIIYDLDSDDTMSSKLLLPDIQDPQKIGSAITYYRRYTLQSLLGLQAEDDDANKASGKTKEPKKEKKELSEEGFVYLMEKGSIDEIKQALKGRTMTKEQRLELEKQQ